MAITNTWSVSDMQHTDATGGVFLVYWSMVASDGTYSATEGGKLRCEPDPSAPGYIAYADLTEADLKWMDFREADLSGSIINGANFFLSAFDA